MDVRNSAGVPKTFKNFVWSKILDAMVGAPDQGDILYRDGTVWTRLPAGTAGYVLSTGGAGANPAWVAPTSVGASSFVAEQIVSGAAATSMTFTGLDLDADEQYHIEYNIDNGSGSTSGYALFFNNDGTASNYDAEVTGMNGSSTGSAGNDLGQFATGVSNGLQISGHMDIRRNFDGKAATVGHHNFTDSSVKIQQVWAHAWVTNANVTRIDITSSVASAISIGSYARIWKLKR